MNYKKEIGKTTAKFEIVFSKQAWENAQEDAYKKEGGKYSVPGFRKGKVPKGMIEKNFGKDIFVEGAVTKLFTEAYRQILSENDQLNPIDYPSIDFAIREDGTLLITAEVEIMLAFEVGKYKGHEIKKNNIKIVDKDINDYLKRMQAARARQIEAKKDHKISMGDIAVIDFVGSIDGVEFQGGTGKDYELEIGSKSFIDTFEEQLVGLLVGDNKDISVKFPHDYHAEGLAGAPAKFAVTIKKIMYKELPKLDDEFVREVSDFDTLEEFKEDIRTNMEKQAEQESRNMDEQALINKIIEETKIEIPDNMVERQLDGMMQDLDYRLSTQGANLEFYAKYLGTTIQGLREKERERATSIIKNRLIFDKIAEIEKITVSKDELEQRIKQVAAQSPKKEAEIRKSAEKLRFIEHDLQYSKIVDFLFANNKFI